MSLKIYYKDFYIIWIFLRTQKKVSKLRVSSSSRVKTSSCCVSLSRKITRCHRNCLQINYTSQRKMMRTTTRMIVLGFTLSNLVWRSKYQLFLFEYLFVCLQDVMLACRSKIWQFVRRRHVREWWHGGLRKYWAREEA